MRELYSKVSLIIYNISRVTAPSTETKDHAPSKRPYNAAEFISNLIVEFYEWNHFDKSMWSFSLKKNTY
jgi:hypothetical protein